MQRFAIRAGLQRLGVRAATGPSLSYSHQREYFEIVGHGCGRDVPCRQPRENI